MNVAFQTGIICRHFREQRAAAVAAGSTTPTQGWSSTPLFCVPTALWHSTDLWKVQKLSVSNSLQELQPGPSPV